MNFGSVIPAEKPIVVKKRLKVVLPKPMTVDFETDRIEGRPKYPPVPVGVSIKEWGKKAKYYAFGHHGGGNNCTKKAAESALRTAWYNPDGVLFHNSKFDLDVAEAHFGLKTPEWRRCHDTMFLLFLDDPNQNEIGLKPAALRLLGQAPEERDDVEDWLVKNQPVPGVKISRTKGPSAKHPAGAYIAYAPGSIVGPYANGDTDRTEALFRLLYARVVERGMLPAYDRERRLLPVLRDLEAQGVRVDTERLRKDVAVYENVAAKLDSWLHARLGVGPEVNLGSGAQLLAALEGAGVVDVEKLGITKKGNVQTNKKALAAGVTDKTLVAVLTYQSQLATCLGTFMKPWLATAEKSGGFIFPVWHQTRGGESGGARTGRLTCGGRESTGNFQNIPKAFEAIFAHEEAKLPKKERKSLPKCPLKGIPPLPLCRSYVIPYEDGHVLVGRDYSQQELRILAHFEGGPMKDQYDADPWLDFHDNTKDLLELKYRRPFKRKPVKNINFGIVYAQGIASLAEKNGESYEQTKELREAVYALYPGLKEINRELKAKARAGEPLVTWGGRENLCQPPAIVDGRIKTFDYRMINTKIQGSAADCTKEAMIRYWETKSKGHRLILTVHDELVSSVPARDVADAERAMRISMESVEFSVPMLTEGSFSADNWASMIDFDKKGVRVWNSNQIPERTV